ncbi:FadR/GntR family transcriptional regulator [Alteromonas lipolytica]|uniref:GntR family transcriptional regulator n=1 Tax=Alteromonas lipolytica TaxID=1856405 RepID=A0A1E8FL51_9ALTE|nr:FadR/GntR family transcriptional regulator [Alteromonas lipolytica]OFI36163.1 GntR family transcriptional regulator [Alteromonas lipolytica]GGF78293.1 GntR family transcriptional regulator [Alteromonas lipolytica]
MARLENLNISQRVANELGKAIVAGVYSQDQAVPTEAQLGNEYGISRTAVREAVKMLTAKGLISSRPRQGIRVEPVENWNLFDSSVLSWIYQSRPSLALLKEFLQMRLAIEPQAAALAAKCQPPLALEKIDSALAAMDSAAQANLPMMASDGEFHAAILLASGNRFFCQLQDFIRTANNVGHQNACEPPHSLTTIVADHRNICQAITSGDAELARSRMTALITELMDRIDVKLRESCPAD